MSAGDEQDRLNKKLAKRRNNKTGKRIEWDEKGRRGQIRHTTKRELVFV